MEQDATRFTGKNSALMVCKLALAEHPESKNMMGARAASEIEVHLMRTDLCKLISVCALPEATGTCTTVTQATKSFVQKRHSPNQRANRGNLPQDRLHSLRSIKDTIKEKGFEPLLYWRLSTASIHKHRAEDKSNSLLLRMLQRPLAQNILLYNHYFLA